MSKAAAQVQMGGEGLKDVQFFGEADRNKSGGIASQVPGWYETAQLDELSETIRRNEHMLERRLVPESEIAITQEALTRDKARYDAILASMPKMTEAQRNRLFKIRAELGTRIGESMFTYSDMERGTADAHEEARRMSEPCISIKDGTGDLAAVVKACNVDRITPDGLITRNDATNAWQIISKYIGENTNPEVLRKRV